MNLNEQFCFFLMKLFIDFCYLSDKRFFLGSYPMAQRQAFEAYAFR